MPHIIRRIETPIYLHSFTRCVPIGLLFHTLYPPSFVLDSTAFSWERSVSRICTKSNIRICFRWKTSTNSTSELEIKNYTYVMTPYYPRQQSDWANITVHMWALHGECYLPRGNSSLILFSFIFQEKIAILKFPFPSSITCCTVATHKSVLLYPLAKSDEITF